MSKPIYVTLKSSDNQFLTYPCKGWLELLEIGQAGSIIIGIWRGENSDGSKACPVEVRNICFEYACDVQFKKIRKAVGK